MADREPDPMALVLWEREVRDDNGLGLGYRIVGYGYGTGNAGWQQQWRPADGGKPGEWLWCSSVPSGLRLLVDERNALAAERSRLERERDGLIRLLRNTLGYAEACRDLLTAMGGPPPPEDGPLALTRALLARLGAKDGKP